MSDTGMPRVMFELRIKCDAGYLKGLSRDEAELIGSEILAIMHGRPRIDSFNIIRDVLELCDSEQEYLIDGDVSKGFSGFDIWLDDIFEEVVEAAGYEFDADGCYFENLDEIVFVKLTSKKDGYKEF